MTSFETSKSAEKFLDKVEDFLNDVEEEPDYFADSSFEKQLLDFGFDMGVISIRFPSHSERVYSLLDRLKNIAR